LPGYTHNSQIAKLLQNLNLKSGVEYIPENMRECYSILCSNRFLVDKELALLESWLTSIKFTQI
jgi:hypothetical protein